MSYIGKKPVDFNDVTEAQTLTVTGDLTVDTNTLYVDSTNNRAGVGTVSPDKNLEVASSGDTTLRITDTRSTSYTIGDSKGSLEFYWEDGSGSFPAVASSINCFTADTFGSAGGLNFKTHNGTNLSTRMTLDNTGHQIVGHTSSVGTAFQPNLQVKGSSSSNYGALGVISSNDEMLGLVGVWSHAENSLFIAADPDNLRSNSSVVVTADAVEVMRVSGEGLKIRGSSFGLVTNSASQTTITLANNAAINLSVTGTTTAGGGILCVYEPSSGESAVYHVGYNRGNLISNSNGSLYATGTTSGKNTIQVSGHQITFTNRTGSSRGYVFNLFIAGGNAYNQ